MSELAQNEQVNTNERIGSKYAIQRKMNDLAKTRLDRRLTQSRVGGQGPYLRSVEHLGRSGIAKKTINAKKVKCDGPTDGPTDRQSGV